MTKNLYPNRNRYSWLDNAPRTKEIVYQMVDNNFPLSSEQFQKEIELIPLCVGETVFSQKYKTRYITITVNENMSQSEILNFGKRISIIEQRIIEASKEFCDRTINRSVYATNLNVLNTVVSSLEATLHSGDIKTVNPKKLIRDIILQLRENMKTQTKLLKSRKAKSNDIKR